LTAASSDTIAIPARFNGPPESSNGGYTCGLVARALDAPVAEVALRRPPPLDQPLVVQRERPDRGEESLRLLDGDAVVAEGRAITSLDVEVPRAVTLEAATDAAGRFPWFQEHAFPTCFVCGPEREEGDGLRIFAGAVSEGDLYACPWTPASEWAAGGSVRSEVVWAALDCPSAVPAAALVGEVAPTAVLATLAASLDRPVAVGEPHVVVSWPVGREGRKRTAASAVLDAGGVVRARARALWIELRD
jgi:hypothetical protein